jgi:hypothetical protein
VVRPSKSGWGVDDGNVAFLSRGYDKGVVVKGVARAAKKASSSLLSPSSESPPGGRGAREAVAPGGRGLEGRRGGEGGGGPLPRRRVRMRAVRTVTGPHRRRCARGGGLNQDIDSDDAYTLWSRVDSDVP